MSEVPLYKVLRYPCTQSRGTPVQSLKKARNLCGEAEAALHALVQVHHPKHLGTNRGESETGKGISVLIRGEFETGKGSEPER